MLSVRTEHPWKLAVRFRLRFPLVYFVACLFFLLLFFFFFFLLLFLNLFSFFLVLLRPVLPPTLFLSRSSFVRTRTCLHRREREIAVTGRDLVKNLEDKTTSSLSVETIAGSLTEPCRMYLVSSTWCSSISSAKLAGYAACSLTALFVRFADQK